MTGLNPASPFLRRWSAGLAVFGLVLARLTAQPLTLLPTNDPATNAFALTNQIAPQLVTTSTETSFSSRTQLEHYDFILATARFQANTHAYADAEKNFVKLLAEDVPEAIEQLLRGYLKERGEGENLRSYFRRKTDDELRTLIAGEPVAAIAHDKPTGRPPVGVN